MMVCLPCPCISFLCGECSSPALPLWRAESGAVPVAIPAFGSVLGRGHLWLPCWTSDTPSSLSAGRRVTLSKFTWPLLGFSILVCKLRLVILIIVLGLPWWLSW